MTTTSITEQIQGSPRNRIIREFVTNAAIFPFFDAIRVASALGITAYITDFPKYFLFISAGIQAWFLGRRADLSWQMQAMGNLIAPIIYTIMDLVWEGVDEVVSSPSHWVYWLFSVGMALFYALEGLFPKRRRWFILLLNLWRVLLFPAIYAISELSGELNTLTGELNALTGANLFTYWFDTSSHLFILLASMVFGLLLGFREIQLEQSLDLLRRIATRLKKVSEWSLSPEMLAKTLDDDTALQQQRVQRTVLFMDIRGFTSWSEAKSPEIVVTMLNQFYQMSEQIVADGGGTKPHFIGDEVMTWFVKAEDGVKTAVSLQKSINQQLEADGLSVGIGLHQGEVVEGLLGSSSTKQFDIIGDTVNTASRLMAAAEPRQLLLSDTVLPFAELPANSTPFALNVKGKSKPLQAYVVV